MGGRRVSPWSIAFRQLFGSARNWGSPGLGASIRWSSFADRGLPASYSYALPVRNYRDTRAAVRLVVAARAQPAPRAVDLQSRYAIYLWSGSAGHDHGSLAAGTVSGAYAILSGRESPRRNPTGRNRSLGNTRYP
jgi:hypothetical protein